MGSDFRAVGGQWGEQEAWQGGLWDEEPELKAEPEKKHIQDWPHTDLRDTEPLADTPRLSLSNETWAKSSLCFPTSLPSPSQSDESGNEKPMQKTSIQKRAEAHKTHLLQTFGHLSTPLQASIQPLSHSQYFKGLQ